MLDDAPIRLRAAFVHLCDDYARRGVFGPASPDVGHFYLQRILYQAMKIAATPFASAEVTSALLTKCGFLEFYEGVEAVAAETKKYDARKGRSETFNEFRSNINRHLGEENVGYELDAAGILQTKVSQEMADATASALHAAQGPYATYAEQLRRALEKLTLRQLDPTNAVKDAVGALEGVARVRLGVDKGDVGALAPKLRSVLHPTLVDALVKVEAFRGDMAAHADKPDDPVTVAEAVFAVHVCSAAISLLIETQSWAA